MPEPITGGEAIIRSLIANGVDTVFGLPGAQLYPLFDALHRHADQITTIVARHEQACGTMAFGYARSTGRPGIFAVVPGPGVLNASAALATAWGTCAPVLCLTGQVPSQFLGRGRGHLHELPDQLATLRTLVKWAARIERPEDAPALVNEAFRQMLTGRPGPVALEMAWDTMASRAPVPPATPATIPPPLPPSPIEIEASADILNRAKRPLIMVGSGAQHAANEVLALAEALDAPVAAFRGGRGIVPESHELGLSSYAAYRLWPEADALIGIGTRLELPTMRWTGMMRLVDAPASPPVIRIDIDPAEMRRLRPHAAIVADSAQAAAALLAALAPRQPGGRTRIATAKREAAAAIQKIQPHVAYLDIIRQALPPDGILVDDLCQTGFTAYFAYPVQAPRTYVSPGFQGTLGAGFMTALGVKVAHPDRPVISITGDGGFLFGVQELATAVQYKIPLVTVLFNNDAYGNVRRDQQTGFAGRVIGAELHNPDFATLACAFAVRYARATTPDALRPLLAEALAADTATLIEVPLDRDTPSPWEFIHPTNPSSDLAAPTA